MNKTGVLIRRTALFAVIVALVALAVALPTFALTDRALARSAARGVVLSQARQMARSAEEENMDRLAGQLAGFADLGGTAYFTAADGVQPLLDGVQEAPQSVLVRMQSAMQGEEALGSVGSGAWAVVPVADRESDDHRALAALLPKWTNPRPMFAALIGVLAGLAAGATAAFFAARKLLSPLTEEVNGLTAAASALAEGDFNARANENAPGGIGGLGKAINSVGSHLADSMYTLILERNRLRSVLDGLTEGIVAIDRKGVVTHTNPALDALFPHRRAAVYLNDPRMRTVPNEEVWQDFDQVMKTGEPASRTIAVRDMSLHVAVSPVVDELGEIAGAVGLFSDVTQQERLELTRREYVSNVSHELRTPLTAMRALVETLKDGMVADEAERQRYYDIMLREVLRLSRLINDQLELSRLQSGTVAIQKSRVALDDLVYDVCDRYSAIAAEKGLELKVGTDFSQCPKVWSNADRVEELLIILLDNAIKYTEQGSVTVSADWDDTLVTLRVADTGIGVSEEDLPHLFERFYKVDKAHSGKGSGLGLAIAKEVLKRMGEEISATSDGSGTQFAFTIHREPVGEEV